MIDQSPHWQPNPAQTWLLQAALLDGEQAHTAWEQWKAALDLDDIDAPSFMLLPRIARQLEQTDEPLLPRIKGVYRFAWAQSQVCWHTMKTLLPELQTAGLDVLLAGEALSAAGYTTRMLRHLEILIRPEQRDSVFAELRRIGWQTTQGQTTSRLPLIPGLYFDQNEQMRLYVRWSIAGCQGVDFWTDAAQHDELGVAALNSTDHLLFLCVAAEQWLTAGASVWIADAHSLICDNPIDWDKLVKRARACQQTLAVHHMLNYLRATLNTPIPTETLAALQAVPAPRFEQREYAAHYQNQPLSRLERYWLPYRRFAPDNTWPGHLTTFPAYLQQYWGAPSMWATWTRMAGSIFRNHDSAST